MAMYFYASKISAIACGTRCKQTVLQKSRGQRDRDKSRRSRHRDRCHHSSSNSGSSSEGDTSGDDSCCDHRIEAELVPPTDLSVISLDVSKPIELRSSLGLVLGEDIRLRRRHSAEQLNVQSLQQGFQQLKATDGADDAIQYDVPRNSHKRSQCDINFESSVLGSGGIMYINGRIVSGPLDSLTELLLPKHVIDLDKDFVFSFLLSSRLFLRPHELLGKLLNSVPESSECLEALVALLAEWTQKFPYDYRDERMMNHVKHIVVRCSKSHLEARVSQVLSALLNRLTDLERHEADLRACQANNDKHAAPLSCPTATQYAQILCRLEKKLAKRIGPEEFLQCSNMVLLDKQKKWDQPAESKGAQDPKKTCNLETYLDWSARLRLFVCNEILQCSGIEDRSRTVELWSGVAQYCLLVGNYNSATAILESLESPAIARLKVTWSKLQVTCQQLDCMQRHAEGHGHLWQKQAIVLNEQQQQQQGLGEQQQPRLKTDKQASLSRTEETPSAVTAAIAATSATASLSSSDQVNLQTAEVSTITSGHPIGIKSTSGMNTKPTSLEHTPQELTVSAVSSNSGRNLTTSTSTVKPNDWVVIPVFADIVKLALGERENCLQCLPNGHIDINAFDRMAAIVGAFTKHMLAMKVTQAPSGDEYEQFCAHMQQTTKLAETDLMMASFDCEEPNNAEKLMYDLN